MALLQHPGNDRFGADEGADQVDVHHLAEVLGGHLGHGDALDDAGVVHQNVHTPQVGLDFAHQLRHLLLRRDVGDVAPGVDALGAVVGQGIVQVGLAAAVEGDFRPRSGQRLGDGKADAVGPTGHQGRFAFQGKHLLHIHL